MENKEIALRLTLAAMEKGMILPLNARPTEFSSAEAVEFFAEITARGVNSFYRKVMENLSNCK